MKDIESLWTRKRITKNHSCFGLDPLMMGAAGCSACVCPWACVCMCATHTHTHTHTCARTHTHTQGYWSLERDNLEWLQVAAQCIPFETNTHMRARARAHTHTHTHTPHTHFESPEADILWLWCSRMNTGATLTGPLQKALWINLLL